jgi:hypothetical protein
LRQGVEMVRAGGDNRLSPPPSLMKATDTVGPVAALYGVSSVLIGSFN